LPTNKIIKEFSNGMRMKVKLLCCLAHKPSLLILDEFTNGLDPVFRYEILDLLSKEAKENNLSILMSTHITSDVEHIADNILFIDNGKILLDITKKDLFDNYKIIKCSKEIFNNIDKKDYIKYLEYKDDNLVIVKDLSEFKKKYKNYETRNNSIEELMLLFIKGKDSNE
jgi:ABC-2 type transport system ATP-binding protein